MRLQVGAAGIETYALTHQAYRGRRCAARTVGQMRYAGIARAAATPLETTPLETWQAWATKVSGAPIDSGHFLTEENPDATARALKEFFGG